MVELIIIEQLLMISTSLILILSSGENQNQKETHPNQEEGMWLIYLEKNKNYLFLEDGILLCSSIISLFMILKMKLGLTLKLAMKYRNGI